MRNEARARRMAIAAAPSTSPVLKREKM